MGSGRWAERNSWQQAAGSWLEPASFDVDRDGTGVVPSILERHLNGTRDGSGQSLGPLDYRYPTLFRQVFKPEILDRGRLLKAVQVYVVQGDQASILLNQYKCRTADLRWIDTKSFGNSSDEGCLPRSKVAP